MATTLAALFGVLVGSFLLGSIPWGVIISRCFYHKDVREVGSGNIGTTNAMRAMGKVGGSAVFVLDFGKGVVSGLAALALARALVAWDPEGCTAFVALMLGDAQQAQAAATTAASNNYLVMLFTSAAFLGCILGHVFSPWLGFKGGKGIAVAAGCLMATFGPVGGLLEIAVFAVVVAATRYVSAGSIAAAAVCPLFALYYCWDNVPAWACCAMGAVVVVWAHRGNIGRLRAGCERRIGSSKGEKEGEDA
ncbi:glycerol-3-phosphate acyltransferase [Xiamenia xianingshaonis]|uniref:Glycerol-3-phosphate acyltransferase n=1 Tax=Xiamenia xianingshaonis TaxID=2682776 RepID=A0A9E6MR23_9ACTN|nr:glycerol-3-phosphate acyltransferase [Xiamenia xianingshaonis]NHM14393.1 acyl-phosphate glycerol 3-phosphate acyltransferase [Xiamenia xianingshaonis]QTU84869.1 glycerol-3-phosphate acyltransferase [Xiamenia xianingshaonis]